MCMGIIEGDKDFIKLVSKKIGRDSQEPGRSEYRWARGKDLGKGQV